MKNDGRNPVRFKEYDGKFLKLAPLRNLASGRRTITECVLW